MCGRRCSTLRGKWIAHDSARWTPCLPALGSILVWVRNFIALGLGRLLVTATVRSVCGGDIPLQGMVGVGDGGPFVMG